MSYVENSWTSTGSCSPQVTVVSRQVRQIKVRVADRQQVEAAREISEHIGFGLRPVRFLPFEN